jgi:metal-sulfur cluster biosynthetic enzyme
MENEHEARTALLSVLDPEVGVNVVDLGLVYAIEASDHRVAVTMTLTSPACPLGEFMRDEAERAIRERLGPGPVIDVRIVREPLWSPERMSDDARRQLRR